MIVPERSMIVHELSMVVPERSMIVPERSWNMSVSERSMNRIASSR
jgi:hypothetical protein